MRRALITAVCLISSTVLLQSCRSWGVILDDWGTTGYARVVGTAHFASGAPVANRPVGYACGPESATGFGYQTTTDARGVFALNIEVPGPMQLPESGEMVCRFLAPADTVPRMSVELAVPFSAVKGDRPTTVIALVEP
jgi:hypothetical protein